MFVAMLIAFCVRLRPAGDFRRPLTTSWLRQNLPSLTTKFSMRLFCTGSWLRARAGVATIKSALSKVLGLFEANDRFVVIDKDVPGPEFRS